MVAGFLLMGPQNITCYAMAVDWWYRSRDAWRMASKQAKASPLPSRLVFAVMLRRARMELGISQEELADRAEVHRTYVGHLERGESNVSVDSMDKLAKALKKPLFELLVPPPPNDKDVQRLKGLRRG